MLHRVFVFGTLKQGFPNFATNRGQRVPGRFVTTLRYPLYLVGERHSPWLLDSPGEGQRIAGQLFEVDGPTLEAMDRLERITEPDGYRRVEIDVEAEAQPAQRASIYLKPREQFDPTEARLGPLGEYTLEHAALYRSRSTV
jgi:gamma-glutamylaminecyclotransferase